MISSYNIQISLRLPCLRESTLRTSSSRVYQANLPLVLRLLGDMPEDALSHGRSADVAEADEKNGQRFRHGLALFFLRRIT